MDIGAVIKRIREASGLTQNEATEGIKGYGGSNLSRLEAGKQKVDIQKLEIIARNLKTSVSAIYFEAEFGQLNPDENLSEVIYSKQNQDSGCPLVSWVVAGNFSDMEEVFSSDDYKKFKCPVPHGKRTFILVVTGRSMEPEYMEGYWIYVDPDVPATNKKDIIIRTELDARATFKQYFEEGNEKYLMARNPVWTEKISVNGNATIIGVVVFKGQPV